jgi:hypothetical protein
MRTYVSAEKTLIPFGKLWLTTTPVPGRLIDLRATPSTSLTYPGAAVQETAVAAVVTRTRRRQATYTTRPLSRSHATPARVHLSIVLPKKRSR